jgi:NAD(P)-dependent dehydrogenase (short-subunit alcohol dehydrogenase family)
LQQVDAIKEFVVDLGLSGKNALVTGASRGIGLAIVSALVQEGMKVVAAARTITPELAEAGAIAISVDLSTEEGPAYLVEQALAQLGELDVLVNNAGGGDHGRDQAKGFLEVDDQQWWGTLNLNLLATVRSTRAALPSLLRQQGAIVNISSIGAQMPNAGPIAYTSAKAALTALSKALAAEFGPQGVRVNTISPGAVRTAMWESPTGYGAELAQSLGISQQKLVEGLPATMGMLTGRFIEPAEVASLVAYLASPLAASIVGANYVIDGGTLKTV